MNTFRSRLYTLKHIESYKKLPYMIRELNYYKKLFPTKTRLFVAKVDYGYYITNCQKYRLKNHSLMTRD